MPVSLGAASTAVITLATSLGCPFTHNSGRSILALVSSRGAASDDGISSVSFNGSNFTQVVDSGPAGAATPFVRTSIWRLDDPGAASATVVATGNTTLQGIMVFAFDVDGAQTGASMIEGFGSSVRPLPPRSAPP